MAGRAAHRRARVDIELELAQQRRGRRRSPSCVVDDGDALGEPTRGAALRARGRDAGGAARLWSARRDRPRRWRGPGDGVRGASARGARGAAELVRRSVPSLPDALRAHLVERVGRRPGALRAAVRLLAGRAIVSQEDIDAALGATSRPSMAPASGGARPAPRVGGARARDGALRRGGARPRRARRGPERGGAWCASASARARIALGRGDTAQAVAELAAVEGPRAGGPDRRRAWQAVAHAGAPAGGRVRARRRASREVVVDADSTDALAADALSVRGVALAFTGEDTLARAALDEAVRVARATGEPRVEAVALGSAAIAHQRAGRTDDARAAYEASLAAAERARDAATVARRA